MTPLLLCPKLLPWICSRGWAVAIAVAVLSSLANAELEADIDSVLVHYRLYVDAGYSYSSTQPVNRLWRSKITDYRIDRLELNLALAKLWKRATRESRWGYELGLQAGVDTELALPDPASGVDTVWEADVLRYVNAANVGYLFPLGNGLEVTAGLIPGFPGYESFLSMENPTYTRGYITDYVPYFLIGVRAQYAASESVDLSFFLVNGWDYLQDVNRVPSLGIQAAWRPTENLTFTQNLYWGAEQEQTNVEYWRFFSDSILEYRSGPLVLAFAFDFGMEKSATEPGNPRKRWLATAVWARWEFNKHWWLGCRPEFYDDPDGLLTGAQQSLGAVAVTLKFWFTPAESHSFALSLEYRYDRSTGPEGCFFSGSDNALTPDQHLILIALTWSFTGEFGQR
ncbi:MAG: outer membrane beta-barrel protein [Planctomycetota bacterium]|jgi:hypothetical protein